MRAALGGGSPGSSVGIGSASSEMRHTSAWHCIHRPGIWHAGGSEEVVEPPAALQGVVDRRNERRPPHAGLEAVGLVGADELGQPCGPGPW